MLPCLPSPFWFCQLCPVPGKMRHTVQNKQSWLVMHSCLTSPFIKTTILPLYHISLGTYGLLPLRVCQLFRSSYSWVCWREEAASKADERKKKWKKFVILTKMKPIYAYFGPFSRIFLRTSLITFGRILVLIRDYHPKPAPQVSWF